jgi:hypothetical protein
MHQHFTSCNLKPLQAVVTWTRSSPGHAFAKAHLRKRIGESAFAQPRRTCQHNDISASNQCSNNGSTILHTVLLSPSSPLLPADDLVGLVIHHKPTHAAAPRGPLRRHEVVPALPAPLVVPPGLELVFRAKGNTMSPVVRRHIARAPRHSLQPAHVHTPARVRPPCIRMLRRPPVTACLAAVRAVHLPCACMRLRATSNAPLRRPMQLRVLCAGQCKHAVRSAPAISVVQPCALRAGAGLPQCCQGAHALERQDTARAVAAAACNLRACSLPVTSREARSGEAGLRATLTVLAHACVRWRQPPTRRPCG